MKLGNRRWVVAAVLLGGAAGCGRSEPAVVLVSGRQLPVVPVQIGSKTYQLEVANDEASREHGLMERDTLAGDHGMIFVFAADTSEGFWMHHTRFPLDILFIDAGGSVVSVKHMLAYDEHTTSSDGPYRYAVELAAGQTDADGVKTGDHLTIPPAAAKTDR